MINWGKAGRCGALILGLGLFMLAIPIGSAWGEMAFGPKDYVRGTGAPKMITDGFTATAGTQCTLQIYNGGMESSTNERVSASVIY